MANIDLGNLTRYDGKIKQYIEDKYLSKNTANWQMTNKAGAVICYPVPDTELEPVVDFMFTETPPVSGDKGPSNPSTITGVSNVTITRCGKNLVRNLQTTTYKGVVFTANADGSITSNRTSSAVDTSFCYTTPTNTLKTGLTYSLSGCPSGGSDSTYCQRFGSATSRMDIGSGLTLEILAAPDMSRGLIRIDSNYSPDNMVFWPQIELGSEITSFEKSEYEDYTIDLGGIYYGGSVNLATGMMTVTHGNIVLDGTENNWSEKTGAPEGSYIFSCSSIIPSGFNALTNDRDGICTHMPYFPAASLGGANHAFCAERNVWIVVNFESTVEGLKTWLASQYSNGNPVTFAYLLKNPFTVQLTPMQIKSLFALDKNVPRLNTLYTDANSIQVGYQKHPARTAYELENAILALGGGE